MGLFSKAKPSVAEAPEKINISSPTGSTQFGSFDEQGNFIADPNIITQQTTESASQQALRENQERLALELGGQLGGDLQQVRGSDVVQGFVPQANKLREGLQDFPDINASSQFDPSQLQSIGGDFSADAATQEQATFDRASNLLAPDFEQQKEDLAQQLANRGIPLTSKAGERELDRLERSQGSQKENLALSSVSAGRQEQERLAQLGLATRGQQFGEQATQAGVGIQEIGLGQQARQIEFGEKEAEFQASLQRQLALANLEAQKRAQQVAEVQGTGLLGTPFQPTPVTSLSGQSTGAQQAGAGFGILGQVGGAFAGTL